MEKKNLGRRKWDDDVALFSVLKPGEGGPTFSDVRADLSRAGIPCRLADSPYVGQYGIEVPRRHKARAARIILGGGR